MNQTKKMSDFIRQDSSKEAACTIGQKPCRCGQRVQQHGTESHYTIADLRFAHKKSQKNKNKKDRAVEQPPQMFPVAT